LEHDITDTEYIQVVEFYVSEEHAYKLCVSLADHHYNNSDQVVPKAADEEIED